jgi:hypothetical protein
VRAATNSLPRSEPLGDTSVVSGTVVGGVSGLHLPKSIIAVNECNVSSNDNDDYYDTAKRGIGIIAHAHAHGGDGLNATTITEHKGANKSSKDEDDDNYDNDADYIDCDVTSSSDSLIEPQAKKQRAKTSTTKRKANKAAKIMEQDPTLSHQMIERNYIEGLLVIVNSYWVRGEEVVSALDAGSTLRDHCSCISLSLSISITIS